ncbi:hypothetical protein BSQ98_18295 [Serratia liquefaciens]|uniref:hypothetical protein n=1 Tax=Serratia liquefaciens TaxID=614 RepID=UPI0010224B00|nr:hypothetical protein [Serratia liquefaciens]RYM61157.1 hypothetical protein BSQ98_18295 [Serratia liquefaciens]
MTITKQGLLDLESDINDILEQDRSELRFTAHAACDRINDPRNNPAITLAELEDIFKRFIINHLQTVLSFPEGTTFTIKCSASAINLPCVIEHDLRFGKIWVVQNVVTVMRKKAFFSKDLHIFDV